MSNNTILPYPNKDNFDQGSIITNGSENKTSYLNAEYHRIGGSFVQPVDMPDKWHENGGLIKLSHYSIKMILSLMIDNDKTPRTEQ